MRKTFELSVRLLTLGKLSTWVGVFFLANTASEYPTIENTDTMVFRSYGGLIPADVFAHLGPDWISGVILFSGIPWRSMVSISSINESGN